MVGQPRPSDPLGNLRQLGRLRQRLNRWNPYSLPRGRVFKFHTWEDLEQWRQRQTNPRLR